MQTWARSRELVVLVSLASAWGCGSSSAGTQPGDADADAGRLGSSSQALDAIGWGADYTSQCNAHGVPTPPPFSTATVNAPGVYYFNEWTQGADAIGSNSLVAGFTGFDSARVYTAESALTSQLGLCAIAAHYGEGGGFFDVICQGSSGYACFWETRTPSPDPTSTPLYIATAFDSGTKLATGHDTCTACHAGRNAFLTHNGVNDGLNGQNDPFGMHDYWMLGTTSWYTPIVPAGWPANPGPSNDDYPSSCTAACHTVSGPAGPFPTLRSSAFDSAHYCGILDKVVRVPPSQGGMPPGNPCSYYDAPNCPAHTDPQVQAMLAACGKPQAPDTAVSYSNSPVAISSYSSTTPYSGSWDHALVGSAIYDQAKTYLFDNLFSSGAMDGWSPNDYSSQLLSSFRPTLFAKDNNGSNLTLAATNAYGQVQERSFGSGAGYRTVSSTLAAGSPYGYVRFDGFNIIVFRGTDDKIYESYWYGGTWYTNPYPNQVLKATGDPIAYNRGSTASVIYKCAELLCEYRLIGGAWQFRTITPAAPLVSGTLPVPFKRAYSSDYMIFYAAADGLHMITDPSEPSFGDTSDQLIYNGLITSSPAPYNPQDSGVRVAFIADYGTGNNSYVGEAVEPYGTSSWLTYFRLGSYNNTERFSGDPAAYTSSIGRNTLLFRNSANTLYQLQTVNSAMGDVSYAKTTVQKGYDIDTSGALTQGQQQTWMLYLPPGQYKFDMTPSSGDADLYTMVGGTPTTTSYDCRPYYGGTSAESCISTIPGPSYGYINVMVNGYAAGTSSFAIRGYFNDQ